VTATVDSGTQATLVVVGGAIHFGATPAACGLATTTNTDSISIAGNAGTVETLVLDMSGGAFAPGATPEGTGISDIELATTLGDAADVVVVHGTSGDDTIRMGQNGMGLNSDTDVDVTFSPLPAQVEVFGLGGANVLWARGGSGTGSIYLGNVIFHAGDDPGNVLDGGAGNDQLLGGASADTLTGVDGNDVLDGAGGDDTITGGNGNDDIDGGPGQDSMSGAGNDDTIDAEDDEADTLISGGSGIDSAFVDTGIDPATVAWRT
jgi:Ca2+-binding RTX toxin-like protein